MPIVTGEELLTWLLIGGAFFTLVYQGYKAMPVFVRVYIKVKKVSFSDLYNMVCDHEIRIKKLESPD